MPDFEALALNDLNFSDTPFPHFSCSRMFNDGLESLIFDWLERTDQWKFAKTSFYTQYEISLSELDMPEYLGFLNSKETADILTGKLNSLFDQQSLKLTDITAHKLVDGHRMGVHNDFIGDQETHRLIVQINPNWSQDNGGFLLFFNSSSPEDVYAVIQPLNNSAIGFEISEKSFHAVSTVHNYNRYTIVYTFNSN